MEAYTDWRKKAVLIVTVLAWILLVSTFVVPPPPVASPPPGPTEQELVTARTLYRVSGDNGWAHEYLTRWPEYADYITGETDRIDICE